MTISEEELAEINRERPTTWKCPVQYCEVEETMLEVTSLSSAHPEALCSKDGLFYWFNGSWWKA